MGPLPGTITRLDVDRHDAVFGSASECVGKVRLGFRNPELEREFRSDYNRSALFQVRLGGILAIVLYGSFALLDAQLAPHALGTLLVIRLGIVCPYILMVVALTFWRGIERIQQPLLCSCVAVSAWGLAVMPLVAPVSPGYSAIGTFLILGFLCTIARALMAYAIPTTLIVAGVYEVTLVAAGASWVSVLYNNFFLLGFVTAGLLACHTVERLRRVDYLREREIEFERARSDRLLHGILPAEVVGRLRSNPAAIAEEVDEVTVLFADIVGFTTLSEQASAPVIVAFLDELFCRFEALCLRHGAEKVKTIGDTFMAVAGVPVRRRDHAEVIARLALAMRATAAETELAGLGPVEIRIGIATGPVVAGVIGRNKFAYDLWGDTVNTASRMESHGQAGAIQICTRTRAHLDDRFTVSPPHSVLLKGKGMVTAHLLLGPHEAPAVRMWEPIFGPDTAVVSPDRPLALVGQM